MRAGAAEKLPHALQPKPQYTHTVLQPKPEVLLLQLQLLKVPASHRCCRCHCQSGVWSLFHCQALHGHSFTTRRCVVI